MASPLAFEKIYSPDKLSALFARAAARPVSMARREVVVLFSALVMG
jgi:hypothetical protein